MKIKQVASIIVKNNLFPFTDFHSPSEPFMNLSEAQKEFIQDFNEKIKNGDIVFETVSCLCGNTIFDLIASVDRYSILQNTVLCTKCGLIQSNPRMAAESYRKFYSSDTYRKCYEPEDFTRIYRSKYNCNYGKHIFDEINKIKLIRPKTRVLEFGAGGGWNLLPFIKAGAEVLGVDYSPNLVQLGRDNGINMMEGGIENIEGLFDVIITNHVLEHLSNPVESLKLLISHLNKNGIIYIAVPNIMNFGMGQLQNAHTYYFTLQTLEYYCLTAGLQLIHRGEAEKIHMFGIFAVQ